jgi:hypothetical protein
MHGLGNIKKYSRLKKPYKKDTRKESIRKWQSQWEETKKGAITKEFFSKCRKETGSESKLQFKCNNKHDRPWKYSILLTSIKNNRKSRVSIQTADHPIFQCKRLKNKREILKTSALKVG